MSDHHRRLEQMYLNAPVQQIYTGISIEVSEGSAIVTLPVMEKFFHAGNSLHGSVYFRLLDDASYFAVNSLEEEIFMLTSSFQIDLLRPVSKGILITKGRVIQSGQKIALASADLFDDRGKLVASGKGSFMKSNINLNQIDGYAEINS